ncbi:MAG: hypothetical protein NC489_26205 [Ruminococcus flavefaciens]|nr:hypothetical protein [Ruminococcus flavefaciens]
MSLKIKKFEKISRNKKIFLKIKNKKILNIFDGYRTKKDKENINSAQRKRCGENEKNGIIMFKK